MKCKLILLFGMLLVVSLVRADLASDLEALGEPIVYNLIGYELLDNNKIVHIWNTQDDYYFNASSGIQFTNHFQEYWTRNIFCAGYKNAQNEWVYDCNDALPFNWNIKTDNLTYVNITGWRDKSIGNKEVRLGLRYHLKLDDKNLSIQPSVRDLSELGIPRDIGFAWRIKDIQVKNNVSDNWFWVWNDSKKIFYRLNNTIHQNYTNLDEGEYKITAGNEFLRLNWDKNLNYLLMVDSKENQYNAPITLAINAGTLSAGQEKHTTMYWIDAIDVDDISDGTDSGTVTLTVPHTCTGTETNGILIVTVQVTDSTPAQRKISSVTHNNEALTHLISADADDGIEERAEIWYRINPTTGGTPDIVVTAGGSCTDLSLGAISLKEVASVSQDTYYFDGSDVPADDPDGVWTTETNADDGNTATDAIPTDTGTESENYLQIEGTNASESDDLIGTVSVRHHDGSSWSEYRIIPPPAGGWTWAKIQGLEVRFAWLNGLDIWFYEDGNAGGAELLTYHHDVINRVSKIEILVATNMAGATANGDSTPPTLNITTLGDSSYVIDSLAIAEASGTKIANATGPAIHKTDVGGDTHASQYVDAGGAGLQYMNYSDVDKDKSWVMSAVAISALSEGDQTKPTYSNTHQSVTNNTNVSVGQSITFGAQWTDDVNLSMYVNSTSINSTTFTNGTFQSFSAGNWSNFTISYPANVEGGNVTFKIFANDTSNNKAETSIWYWENVTAPTDTCTCPASGNWLIQCSDNCDIQACDMQTNNVLLNGTGNILSLRNVTNATRIRIQEGCVVRW